MPHFSYTIVFTIELLQIIAQLFQNNSRRLNSFDPKSSKIINHSGKRIPVMQKKSSAFIAWCKKQKESSNVLVRGIFKALSFIRYHVFWKGLRLIRDAEYRSVVITMLFHKDQVQQTTQYTAYDRYPEIFRACQQHFADQKDLKILSFGCCTGEEVVSLRNYFPEASIVGAEINKRSLKICKARKLDTKVKFIYSTHENIMEQGPYDLVFCNAVLERLPMLIQKDGVQNLREHYPFDKFQLQLKKIDQYVKKEGMLVIVFSQYELMDTDLADSYQVLDEPLYLGQLFDRDCMLVSYNIFRKCLYVKK